MPNKKQSQMELLKNAAPTERAAKAKAKANSGNLSPTQQELMKNVSPTSTPRKEPSEFQKARRKFRGPSSDSTDPNDPNRSKVRVDDIYYPPGHPKAGLLAPHGDSMRKYLNSDERKYMEAAETFQQTGIEANTSRSTQEILRIFEQRRKQNAQ